jgi:hypothetical protein
MVLRKQPKRGCSQCGCEKHSCSGHASLQALVVTKLSGCSSNSYPVFSLSRAEGSGKTLRCVADVCWGAPEPIPMSCRDDTSSGRLTPEAHRDLGSTNLTLHEAQLEGRGSPVTRSPRPPHRPVSLTPAHVRYRTRVQRAGQPTPRLRAGRESRGVESLRGALAG